jgi:poly [ADP-ribose] polymerase 2/3/4
MVIAIAELHSDKQACSVDKCQIVSLDWLLDSQNAKKKASEKKYLFGQNAPAAPVVADTDKKRRGRATTNDEPPAKKLREKSTEGKKKLNIPVDEGCKDGCE